MGIFKKMAKAFLSGFPTHPRKEQMRDLLYPEALPNFQRLAADNHRDKRALTYTLRGIDTKRKRPVTPRDLTAGDFTSERDAMQTLLSNGLVRELTDEEAMGYLYGVDEMKSLLRERGATSERQ